MMNPEYYFERMREMMSEFEPSIARRIAFVRLEECRMWLMKCKAMEGPQQPQLSFPQALPQSPPARPAVVLSDTAPKIFHRNPER